MLLRSAEVNNTWIYTSTPPWAFMAVARTTLLHDIRASHSRDVADVSTDRSASISRVEESRSWIRKMEASLSSEPNDSVVSQNTQILNVTLDKNT